MSSKYLAIQSLPVIKISTKYFPKMFRKKCLPGLVCVIPKIEPMSLLVGMYIQGRKSTRDLLKTSEINYTTLDNRISIFIKIHV